MPRLQEEIPVNRYVRLKDGRVGLVKFYGYIDGKRKRFVGVQLIDSDGKHDGTIKGKTYFSCPAGRGLMTSPKKIEKIFPARMKKRQVREECRLDRFYSQFPAVGMYADRLKSATRALVNAESSLSGIFSDETLNLIFAYAEFLRDVDDSAQLYQGNYHFRVQRMGSEVKDWKIDMTLFQNGSYEITGLSTVGYCAKYDYVETGSFSVYQKSFDLESDNAEGENIGSIFHGTCHKNGSKVRRSMKIKDVLRFKTEDNTLRN